VPAKLEHPVGARGKQAGKPVTAQRPDGTHCFAELAESFLTYLETNRRCSPRTLAAYRSDYRRIASLLEANGHSLDAREITSGDLEVCTAALNHLSAASVERLIYALASLFRHICRRGIIHTNPVDDLARPQRERKLPRVFTSEEADRLFAACQTSQERLIIALLRCCGLRRAELLAINLADVAADFSCVRVCGKGRRQRDIPLHASLRKLLEEHVANLPDGDEPALIRNSAGKRTSPTTLHRLFQKLLRRCGLADENLSMHSLRHYFATALLRQGTDIATVAELLGHSNVATTSHYLHADSASKRTAIEQLPALHVGGDLHEGSDTH